MLGAGVTGVFSSSHVAVFFRFAPTGGENSSLLTAKYRNVDHLEVAVILRSLVALKRPMRELELFLPYVAH